MLRKILTLFLFVSPLFAQTNTFIPGGNVNSQTNSYTAVATDVGKIIEMNCSGCVLKLPNPIPFPSWTIYPKNINPSTLTINPNGSSLDHSVSNAFITQGQWLTVTTDGLVYTSLSSGGTSSGGGGTTPPAVSVTVNPTSINFGTVQNNTVSDPQLVTINNNGTLPVIVNGASLTGSKFTGNLHACDGLLDPGGCSLLISHAPTASVTDTDTLTFSTNVPVDPQSPLTVSLSGTGQAGATFPITLSGFGTGGCSVTDTANANSLDAAFNAGQASGTFTFNYASGTPVTLAATALSGSTFVSFGGTGITATSPSSFTVTQSQTISVTCNAVPQPVQVSLAATGQGSGTMVSDVMSTNGILSCAATAGQITTTGAQGCFGPYLPGTILNVTPTAGASSTFVGWTGGGSTCMTGTCQIVVGTSPITLVANFAQTAATAQIALIQAFTNAAVSGATVSKAFANAQQAGDINICFLDWADASSTVSSFSDSVNGAYTQVPTISPKVGTGLTQSVYYFQNIAAGTPTVTATLSTSAASAVAGTSLTSAHNNGTSTTYTTASVTLGNNDLILATFWGQLNSGNGPGAMVSVADTGCGLTWQLAQALNFNSTQGTGTTTHMETWRTLGNGSACTITGTWTPAVAGRGASVSQFSGVDTSGSNGSGAIGIKATNTGSGTTPSVTMGAFGSAANATFGVFGSGASQSRTQGAGMTLLGADGLVSDEWAAGNVSPVQQTLGAGAAWGGIGIEIKSSGGSSRRDLRCLEYAGIKATGGSPIDTSVAAIGTSAAPSSGGITTGTANDLVIGGTASNQSVNTASTSYTQQLKDAFGDDAEDRQGVVIATYPFAPALTTSGNWVASQIGFLGATTSAPTTFSLTVNNSGSGSGTTTSNAGTPNISCGITCSSTVPQNSTPTLTAIANPGSVFDHWIGPPGCSTSPSCQLPVFTQNQNVTAVYTASGQTLYFVNGTTGSDNNDGLAATAGGGHGPWRTFNKAMNAVKIGPSGTVVSFAPFNYAETVTLPQGGSSFARLSFVCNTPFTVGGSNCKMTQINTYGVNNVDIGAIGKLGFEITQPAGIVLINNNGNFSGGNNNTFAGNYLHGVNTSGTCALSGAILGGNRTNLKAIGNFIDDVGQPGCTTMHGIYFHAIGAVEQDNVITRVRGGAAIQHYSDACSGVISNNDLLNSHWGLILLGGAECTPGLNTVSNNDISNNSVGVYNGISSANDCVSGRSTLYTNNIMFGNGANFQQPQPACEIRQNTLSENPTATFLSYTGDATGNYQLKAGSIAINGGTAQCVTGGVNPCIPSIDILNVSRPQRANFDIGAYELP